MAILDAMDEKRNMTLRFGDYLSNALHEIKAHTGKKISILQDEIGYTFSPALTGVTIERWRYRNPPTAVEHLEQLAAAILAYRTPAHNRAWLAAFLKSGHHPYVEPVCNRFFPEDPSRFAPPPVSAYAPPGGPAVIGRKAILEEYAQALNQTGGIIICGMAGVGKTALATTLAQQYQQTCPIFWHTITEPSLEPLLRRLAGFMAHCGLADLWDMFEAARIAQGPPPDLTTVLDLVAVQLPSLNGLLCLDDLHRITPIPPLQTWLERLSTAPQSQIKLLITSRRYPTFLAHIPRFTLPGLSLADTTTLLTTRQTDLSPSLTQALHQATEGNATFLVLAMAVMKHLPNEGDRAKLITRLAQVDNIERYLMTEINDHLTPLEQQVMGAISLLLGQPAHRAMLEQVVNQAGLQRSLRSLQDQFLLQVSEGENGRTYRQHQIMQTFYYGQLSRHQRILGHRQVAVYYQAQGNRFQTALHQTKAGDNEAALTTISEHLAAIINEGMAEPVSTLIADLLDANLLPAQQLALHFAQGQVATLLGHSDVAQHHFAAATTVAQNLPDGLDKAEMKAKICLGLSTLLERQAPPEALGWAYAGLALAPAIKPATATALTMQVGVINMVMGNLGEALENLHHALDHLVDGPAHLQITALKNLGAVYFNRGQLSQAQRYTDQARQQSEALHDHWQTARIYINAGPIKYVSGDWAGAIADLEQGLALAQRLGGHDAAMSLHINLGACYVDQGDDERAVDHLQQGLALAQVNGSQQAITARIRLGQLQNYRGQWSQALETLAQAEQQAHELNAQHSLPLIWGYMATAHFQLGHQAEAERLVQQARQQATALGNQMDAGILHRILGNILSGSDDPVAIQHAFARSIEILAPIDRYQTALSRLDWGLWHLAQLNEADGKRLLSEAQAVFTELGATRDIARVQVALTW